MVWENVMKNYIIEKDGDKFKYVFKNGYTMKREYDKTPKGNKLEGHWVLRNGRGDFIDFDKYRHDLSNRNNLKI